MSPFHPDLLEYSTDYLHTATDLHTVVPGSPGKWRAVVRGTVHDDERPAVVGVAWYDSTYHLKADATKRAREVLRAVKAMRLAELAAPAGEG